MTAMLMNRRTTKVLWLLSMLSIVRAQTGAQTSYKFDGDSRIIADTAVWCIADLANIIIALLCFVPILRLNGHRAIYIALSISSFLLAVQSSVCIGYIFYAYNGAQTPSLEKKAALLSTMSFFGSWSYAFQYLTIVILLHDRAKQITRGALFPIEITLFKSSFIYSGIILIAASVYAGLSTKAALLKAEWLNLGQDAIAAEAIALVRAEHQASIASFTFFGLWFFSTVIVTTLAVVTYVRAQRMGVKDEITKNVLLMVVPLYYAAMIVQIVFTIFASPSIIVSSSMEDLNITFANDILTLFLHTGIMTSVLVFGFKAGSWKIRDHAVALSTLGALSSGDYVELDEPHK